MELSGIHHPKYSCGGLVVIIGEHFAREDFSEGIRGDYFEN